MVDSTAITNIGIGFLKSGNSAYPAYDCTIPLTTGAASTDCTAFGPGACCSDFAKTSGGTTIASKKLCFPAGYLQSQAFTVVAAAITDIGAANLDGGTKAYRGTKCDATALTISSAKL